MWSNPFDSDNEDGELREETSKKKISTPKVKKTPAPRVKKAAATPAPVYPEVGSETEDEHIPCAQPKKRKRILTFVESDDELEPVRASALKNFLSRRTGLGNSFQSDPSRRGEYYIELRVYNTRELEASQLSDREKCKLALINMKTTVNGDASLWRSVSKVVSEGKQEFKGIRPVIYPSNKF